MAFVNELIPPIEQETSEFARQARKTLNTGHSQFDTWTIDRERNLILMYHGSDREVETSHQQSWRFVDSTGKYWVYIDLVSKTEISSEEIAITRSLRGCVSDNGELVSDAEIVAFIKEGLQEYKDWGVISDYKHCLLTLTVNSATAKGI